MISKNEVKVAGRVNAKREKNGRKHILSLLMFLLIMSISQKVSAEELEAGQPVVINLSENCKQQNLTFTVSENGYAYFVIERLSDTTEEELTTLNYSILQNYRKYEESNVYYGTPKTSSYYSFKKGSIIELNLGISGMFWEDKGVNVSCRITAFYKSPKNFESKKNVNKKNADKVKRKTTYRGLTMSDSDDWYVFKAPKTGKYAVNCVITEGKESYHGLQLYVYTKAGKMLTSMNVYPERGWMKTDKIKMKKGQKYYIKINSSYHNLYQLKIK